MWWCCKIEMPDGPVVYRANDGKVYVDFLLSERFDIVRWVEIVGRVNDEMFKLTMNGGDDVSDV